MGQPPQQDGVLTLTIPIAEAVKPRRIEITANAGRPAVDSSTESAAVGRS
ncbi:hypothetical protein ACWKSP_35225 [Micromonosporaceae bacterium Da 78-11]